MTMTSIRIRGPMGYREFEVVGGDATHVTATIVICGEAFTWEFALAHPYDRLIAGLSKMASGALAQDALPWLTPDERENFITPPMWRQ